MDEKEQPDYFDNIEQEAYGYVSFIDRVINPSTIMSLASAVLLVFGITQPIIDFSIFNNNIDIRYNFLKVCSNVGIISPIWNGIPYGITVGIVMLVILSFVNIPPLKVIPCVLIIVMYAIVLFDLDNVISWGNQLIDKLIKNNDVLISKSQLKDGIMQGAYFTAFGLLIGIVSCFVKGAKLKHS